MTRSISILGATGSIGKSTLDIIERYPRRFKVFGMTTNNNIDLLYTAVKKFKPKAVAIGNEAAAAEFRQRRPHPPGLRRGTHSVRRPQAGRGPQARAGRAWG